jgi:glycosyltransferase involved in cell wall biosynthesis
VVAVSHGVADVTAQMTKVPRSRIHVIYNPVVTPEMLNKAKEPLEHPWFAPGQPQVAMAVGSLLPVKDFSTLIRAFSTLRKDRAVRLMILGEGPERPRLESLLRALHLEDDVALPGFVENPYAYMSRAAVLVLSSKWEALPSVLIEGLALRIPVVSTDCDFGPREILAHGKYGTLVPVGDVEALAEGVRQALSAGPPSLPVDALAPFGVETPVREYLRVLLGESHE